MNLEVFILGTGGMMPLPRRFLTSVLVRREGELFLFDCGEGTQVSLKMLNLRWKQISSIFISHMHADHVTGLPGMLMLSSQVDRTKPLYIFGPRRIRQYVNETRRILDMYINYDIIVREIDEPGIVWDEEEFTITCFWLNHTKPCLGYALIEKPRPGIFNPAQAEALGVPRGPLWSQLQHGLQVSTPDGRIVDPAEVLGAARNGRKFTFVTDTAYLPTIAREASGSDLFICEGMFEHALEAAAREKKHLTSLQAATIARDAGGIDSLGLIHFSPRYTERELRELLEEAKTVFPHTFLCRDRQTIPLLYKD